MKNLKELNEMVNNGAILVMVGTGQVETDKAIAAMAGIHTYSEVKDIDSYEGEDATLVDGTEVYDGDQVYEVIV